MLNKEVVDRRPTTVLIVCCYGIFFSLFRKLLEMSGLMHYFVSVAVKIVKLVKRDPNVVVILSGGFTNDKDMPYVSEAYTSSLFLEQQLRSLLPEQKVRIELEEAAANTPQNINFSCRIIRDYFPSVRRVIVICDTWRWLKVKAMIHTTVSRLYPQYYFEVWSCYRADVSPLKQIFRQLVGALLYSIGDGRFFRDMSEPCKDHLWAHEQAARKRKEKRQEQEVSEVSQEQTATAITKAPA